MLKPNDIIIPEFSKVIAGGYKPTEVKAFIDQLVSDYTEVYEAYVKREKELREVALQLKETSEKYYELSQQKTVSVPADALSAEIIDSATADAAKIIEEANTRAAEIICEAKQAIENFKNGTVETVSMDSFLQELV